MKIYQTFVFTSLISLLYIVVVASERFLHLEQIRLRSENLFHFSKFYLRNINNFFHIYFNGLESRRMHPPNKPHPA